MCVSFKSHASRATECAIGLSFEFIIKQHVENVAKKYEWREEEKERAREWKAENKQTVNNIMFDEHMNRRMGSVYIHTALVISLRGNAASS